MPENKHITEFSKEELQHLADNHQLIDVRTKEEYQKNHIPGSLLHTLDEIESFNLPKDKYYYIYCRSGNRSGHAANILETMGYNATNLDGGMLSYNEM